MGFVEKLVEFMPSDKLALQDSDGATAFSKLAVRYGHKELTLYLLSVTRALICISFLKFAWNRTSAQSTNDVALYLVKRYPDLATCHFDSARHNDANDSDKDFAPLTVLGKRP
ncbi:hypothetical protein CK203_052389 [Vitis vinifera]|uniref:Uncharacterized protein n=1 Tax=Vitis vinifera TaxID=29760 RepID=A0A438H6R5_VITVI|nr:hypothetical protein CK203_052389 [Vitis vinifera]